MSEPEPERRPCDQRNGTGRVTFKFPVKHEEPCFACEGTGDLMKWSKCGACEGDGGNGYCEECNGEGGWRSLWKP